MSLEENLDNLVKVVGDYGEEFFFYVIEGTREQVGVGIDYVVKGSHEIGKAVINLLNRDYMDKIEQYGILLHEVTHGVLSKLSEEIVRLGDATGYHGIEKLVYS
ncbi:MAG: hypothetical protein CMH64_03265 [Nanoarchaeota archaeon]|nr:hypothetical protein [Nanoarchaeota archaeon]|tara:strand:- start:1182 stop:1493 length:312 start_codon:yes stop_codon:yes gene_type:complete